ncbi:hypothetical protein EMA8858_03815 [Emticicia aquatica]|jgi:hypothetical protein|uniref:Uncharacterized protein n=1 Tax=Emticicia aquatica TaxID=1681835 RepID=A0ABN8F083_9BACT|nr:hypothetical protein [Emticicia aquatica]CAH0997681.1 hypothetical protein EMA8858_03815 [Emticicia aquatica]
MLQTILRFWTNLLFTQQRRPGQSHLSLRNPQNKFVKYVSFEFINGLFYLIDFFISELEKKGIYPENRLLRITELNLRELKGLKECILQQSTQSVISNEDKKCLLKLSPRQRRDIYCIFIDYEIVLLNLSQMSSPQDWFLLKKQYLLINNFRKEMNEMIEVKVE